MAAFSVRVQFSDAPYRAANGFAADDRGFQQWAFTIAGAHDGTRYFTPYKMSLSAAKSWMRARAQTLAPAGSEITFSIQP